MSVPLTLDFRITFFVRPPGNCHFFVPEEIPNSLLGFRAPTSDPTTTDSPPSGSSSFTIMFSARTTSGITNAVDDPLTQALNGLVPPDEDPIARANRLALEADARHVSEQIDEKLRLERLEKKNKKIVKILLLGQSDRPLSFRIAINRLLLCGRLAYPHVDTPHTRVSALRSK